MTKLQSIPEHGEYPQLREIADPERLAEVMQVHLGPRFASGKLRVDRCKIGRVYYKPGPDGSCKIRLKARIRASDGSEVGKQMFFGHVFPSGLVQTKFEKVRGRARAQPAFGQPVALIPDWNMILWAYPNDPGLVGLPTLSAPDKVLAMMQRAPERFGLAADQTLVEIEACLTKYVPGRRCGYIYRTKVAVGDDSGSTAEHMVYGKAYRDQAGRAAYDILEQIWGSEARQRGALCLPEPYSYDEDLNILWQEALPGRPLSKMPPDIDLPTIAVEIARQLAAFHGTELDLPTRVNSELELANLRERVEIISRTFPQVAERCAAVQKRLTKCADDLGRRVLTPVHGSFKFSHTFAGGGQVALIDFDGANLGDPAYDLGHFVAHLRGMEAAGKVAGEVAEKTVENFCTAYHEETAFSLSRERIMWFAASLIMSSQIYRMVKRSYKVVERYDPNEMAKLLTLAEQACPGQ